MQVGKERASGSLGRWLVLLTMGDYVEEQRAETLSHPRAGCFLFEVCHKEIVPNWGYLFHFNPKGGEVTRCRNFKPRRPC